MTMFIELFLSVIRSRLSYMQTFSSPFVSSAQLVFNYFDEACPAITSLENTLTSCSGKNKPMIY